MRNKESWFLRIIGALIRSAGIKRAVPQQKYSDHSTKIFHRPLRRTGGQEARLALMVMKGPDQGREFLLAPSKMKIGRQVDNYIKLQDPKVSREHALLEYNSGRKSYIIKDLGSTNGTFINERRVKVRMIIPGDEIRVGDSTLKVVALEK